MSDNHQTFKEINTQMPPESESRHNNILWLFLFLFLGISASLFLYFSTPENTEKNISATNSNTNQKHISINLTDETGNQKEKKEPRPKKVPASDADALNNQQKITTPEPSDDNSEHKITKQIPDQPPIIEESNITFFTKNLTFDFDSTDLDADALSTIQDMFNKISDKSGRLFIEGHITSDEYLLHQETGYDLTEIRVKNVANAFRKLWLGINIRISMIFGGQVITNEASEKETRHQVSITFKPD